jgi:Immunoglobulin I-set domain
LFVNERISFEKDGSKYKMTILKANMDDSGTYSVCATNEVSQATEYWNLAVSQPPKFIKGLVKSMDCKEQENVSLDVKIQCKPAPQVKWYICKPSATSQTKEYK